MEEGFAVISGKVDEPVKKDLKFITDTAKQRYGDITVAHHEWINDLHDPPAFREALDRVRTNITILDGIRAKFPGAEVRPVTEADEIYWSVSPKGAKGSDRALVDCHRDAPFFLVPTGGVTFYRVIIACNENDTVTTAFPDENVKVKMDLGDFHGLDYNSDSHCVEGSIPQGTIRVLLKLHYLVVPKGASENWADFIRSINIQWTFLSRYIMRVSAAPKNLWEHFLSWLVYFSRIIYNNGWVVIAAVAALIVGLYMRGKTRRQSKPSRSRR